MKNPGQSAECRHDVTVLVDRALKKKITFLLTGHSAKRAGGRLQLKTRMHPTCVASTRVTV